MPGGRWARVAVAAAASASHRSRAQDGSMASRQRDFSEHLRQGSQVGRSLLRLGGRRWQRALHQDGAQRHRVRRHAAVRGGVLPPQAHWPLRQPESARVLYQVCALFPPAQRSRAAADAVARRWRTGDLDSFLIDITADIFACDSCLLPCARRCALRDTRAGSRAKGRAARSTLLTTSWTPPARKAPESGPA